MLSEDELANHLRNGRSYREIAEAESTTKRKVQLAVDRLRALLAAKTGNTAFLTEANPVEVGRAWFGEELENEALWTRRGDS